MSQHDLIIDNATFPSLRADLNNALQALGSTNKGTSRPSTVYAGQMWIDDNTPSSSVWTVYWFDGTDDIKLGEIDTSSNNWMPFVNGVSLTSYLATYTFPGTEATLASASTTNLGSTGVFAVSITGTTTINSLGSGAAASAPLYFTRFTGALQLTHNATSQILIGGANITTAAGATATWLYLGSGNWRMLSYEPALSASKLVGVGSSGGKAALSVSSDLTITGTTVGVNTGTSANQIVKLNGSGQLPAVDGSQLTGVTTWPGVYTGTSSSNDTFPVGTTLLALVSGAEAQTGRNAAVNAQLGASSYQFAVSGGGTLLTGSWNTRGGDGTNTLLMERTA